jgi:hypothetical protein
VRTSQRNQPTNQQPTSQPANNQPATLHCAHSERVVYVSRNLERRSRVHILARPEVETQTLQHCCLSELGPWTALTSCCYCVTNVRAAKPVSLSDERRKWRRNRDPARSAAGPMRQPVLTCGSCGICRYCSKDVKCCTGRAGTR